MKINKSKRDFLHPATLAAVAGIMSTTGIAIGPDKHLGMGFIAGSGIISMVAALKQSPNTPPTANAQDNPKGKKK